MVAFILAYAPDEKIRGFMADKGIFGNVIGALFGALTPFCACSTIPLTIGFLQAGISIGAVMSFLIASPLLNPIILGMLVALMGLRVCVAYFIIVFTGSIIFGEMLEKTGAMSQVKNVRLKNGCYVDGKDAPSTGRKEVLLRSFTIALNDYRGILGYLLVGVGVGASIYGFMPEEIVLQYAGPTNKLAIPFAAAIGIPLYIRAETAIPIGISLMQKGMSIGAVVALIIGGAGMAIPEMSMLSKIFKKKLMVAIVTVIFSTAVIAGYFFNYII